MDFSKKYVTAGLLLLLTVFSGCSKSNELEWQQEEGYRWAELDPGFFGSTGFEKKSKDQTNIHFNNSVSKDLIDENRHYLNGSGVTVADIDGDGLQDIYLAAIDGPNKLYRNRGNFEFEEISEVAGLALENHSSTGVIFSDLNGDRYPDLLISSLLDRNLLFINDGQGKFSLKEDSGLGESKGGYSMALADIDGDRDLDLYIANYKARSVKDLYEENEIELNKTIETVNGQLVVKPEFQEHYAIVSLNGQEVRTEKGTVDELYLNKGDGTFSQVDALDYFYDPQGIPTGLPTDWGLSATFRDINGDGRPDLYVANDFWTQDRLWINRGDGTFESISSKAVNNMSFSAMGVDFSDINRDGHLDYVVTEMLSDKHSLRLQQVSQNRVTEQGVALVNRNSLYLNRGDSTFAQIAYFSGLEASGWSWATSFLDVDLDGYEDLIVANGYQYDYLDMETQFRMSEQERQGALDMQNILSYPPLNIQNKVYRNQGDLRFEEVSTSWGFAEEDISQGMATADFDNDGDLDLVMNRFNEEAAIYENTTTKDRITVMLKGSKANPYGVGAKIRLLGGSLTQEKEIVAGGNYLSGSQPAAVFAAGEAESYIIEVIWRDGELSTVEGAIPNRIYEVDRAKAQASEGKNVEGIFANQEPIFENVSNRLNHSHTDNPFDDESVQPLVPQKLSRQGPGIAWIDYNADGIDDLFIGTGRGGEAALFENNGEGEFISADLGALTNTSEYDQTGIISWKEGGYTYLVVGNSIYEHNTSTTPSATLLLIGPDGELQEVKIPRSGSSTGPLAAADIDGNGYVDLFIGGHFIPGRYPEDAESRIILNDDGNFQMDQVNAATMTKLGLVSSAVFTDYNGDHQPDLLISNEWGALRLFENNQGLFIEKTDEVGLSDYKGWWRGVATGDFNNDGCPDIVASNIGLNSYYQETESHPLRLYYKDFNADGVQSIIDSYYSEEVQHYVPRRRIQDFGSVPSILKQVKTYRDFSSFSVSQIFGEDFSNLPRKEITTLKHTLFLNLNDGFEAVPIPDEAQFSAASYVGVLDYNNDGNEDLFMSQNFFAMPREADRLNAGRGLLLQGDGTGKLEPISGSVSGIKLYGDQRGAALGDFNKDGRTDIAVSQHGGQTGLFLNGSKQRGINVRLVGPESNRDAIGSSVQLSYPQGERGPLREIQAGSGYWAQNSKEQVLGYKEEPEMIEVFWFDGKRDSIRIEGDKMEYVISY